MVKTLSVIYNFKKNSFIGKCCQWYKKSITRLFCLLNALLIIVKFASVNKDQFQLT